MTVEQMTPEQERFYMASQWRMMWWRFRRHRLAVVAGALLLIFYATIFVSEFLSPDGFRTSAELATALLNDAHVALTPGEAFDAPGSVPGVRPACRA